MLPRARYHADHQWCTGETRQLLLASPLRHRALARLGQRGEQLADLQTGLSAIEDEAPRGQAPMIGNARGDPNHLLDLGIAGRRLLELVDRRRDPPREKINDRGGHGWRISLGFPG